ncbi:MAG: hypothetical protein WAM85_20085, partial [Terracidiphilus sp.]
ALSSTGANRTSGLGMITALSLMEQGFRSLPSPVAFVRAGGFFENFLFGLQAAQGGTLPVFYNPTNRKSTMVASDDIGAEVAILAKHFGSMHLRSKNTVGASGTAFTLIFPMTGQEGKTPEPKDKV